MSAELILNVLVGVSLLNSIVGARFKIANQQIKYEQYGVKFGAWLAFSTLALLALWVLLAIATGYWQFAAMVAGPFLVAVGGVAAGKQEGRP